MKLALEITNKVFDISECSYRLRNELGFKSRNIRTVMYEIETTLLLAPGYGDICPVN